MIINKEKSIAEIVELAAGAENWQDLCSKLSEKLIETARGADAGFLMQAEDNFLTLQAAKGFPAGIFRQLPLKIGQGDIGQVAKQGKGKILDDLKDQDETNFLHSLKYQSALVMPLIAHGELMGVIGLFSVDKKAFSSQSILELEDICDIAALSLSSLKNSQLSVKTARSKKEAKILSDSLKSLSYSLGFSETIYTFLATCAAFSGAQKSAFAKYDRKQNAIIIQSPSYGISSEQAEKLQLNHDEKIGGKSLCTGTYQVLNQLDKEHRQYLDKAFLPEIKSILVLPLKSQSRSLGILYLFSEKENNFPAEDIEILEKIASPLGTTISHADSFKKSNLAEAKAETILSSVEDGIVAIDSEKNIIFANKAFDNLIGTKNENFGKSLVELFHLKEVGKMANNNFSQELDKVLFQGKSNSIVPVSIINPVGKSVSFEAKIRVMENKSGEKFGAIITFKNSKDKTALEEMQNTLLAVAAHELQNPVTGIKGYLELALSESGGRISSGTREILEEASAVAERLSRQIEDILYVSRLEEGKISLQPRKFDLVKSISETLAEFSYQAKEKNLHLSFNEKEPIFVRADPKKTKEILANFIDNALKYSFKGEVKIALTKIGNFIETAVIDNGVGIAKENTKNLFSKFYRIVTPETKNIVGTGLGLWIAKNLVEKQKGKVAVISDKGVGSTFKFTLPSSDSV